MALLTFLALFAGVAFLLSAFMFVAWRVEQKTGNAGWVDAFWSFGTGAAAALGSLAGWMTTGNGRAILVAALVALWSIRLGSHVAMRSSEVIDDPRYARLRREWGAGASMQMLKFLQLQAVFGALLGMCVIVAAWNPAQLFLAQDLLALLVIAVAIGGEAFADWQLRQFRKVPANRGRICDSGLWRYSRHPNYFFECMFWLSWPLFAINLVNAYHPGWFSLLAPLCMYWLLTRVSGIPPLENVMLEKYGARYSDYQSRTSAFFPFPPAPRKDSRA